MTEPTFQATGLRVRGARPKLPRMRAVLLEQVRVTGLALRGAALMATALVALVTLFAVSQVLSRGADLTLNAWPTQLPGLLGALLPIAVWARDQYFGPAFLWTLPLDRRRHALAKVLAGWVWLMVAVALFALWLLAVTAASGGRALPPEALLVLGSQPAGGSPVDPGALRTVSWAPGLMIWALPFTAATAPYLLGSALVLGVRRPLRWVIGAVLAYTLASIASEATGALDWAPGRLLRLLVESRYGLDALLTGRIELLSDPVTLTTGKSVIIWWSVPDLADWRTATVLWTGAGGLALWAAVSRHRERRRA
ncbi:MAG: hypothetical protein JWM95_2729 [Gemmatimonadetes bacterium]|nr:hypothetical protein [Gemmatimonadota bacterium]